jgi:hypothetical protein
MKNIDIRTPGGIQTYGPGRQSRKHHALPVILTAAALHLSGEYELCGSTHLAFQLWSGTKEPWFNCGGPVTINFCSCAQNSE